MPVLPASSDYTVNTSGNGIIERALRLLRMLGEGETLSAKMQTDGLVALNGLLDAWNTKKLAIYARTREEFTLTVSDGEYTIGPGGDFDTIRPVRLDQGDAFLEDDGTTEFELVIINQDDWGRIVLKDTDGIPSLLYYEPAYPLGILHLYPRPDDADVLVLYSRVLLSQITKGNEALAFPPGYFDALCYNLALALADEYGKEPSLRVQNLAKERLADIKAINMRTPRLVSDAPSSEAYYSDYDILRGY